MNYRPKNSFSMSYASRKVIFPGALQPRWTTLPIIQHNILHTHLRQHTSPPGFAKTPFFLGGLRFYFGFIFAYLCVRLFTPCVQVYLRLWQPPNTTQYGPRTVVRLPGQLTSIDVLRKLATWFSRHNRHNRQHNTTRAWKRSSSMKSFSEDSTLRPTTLRVVLATVPTR